MKSCLNDNELLQLHVADDGGYAGQRAHLAECSRCAEHYQEVARDSGAITIALTQAADHLTRRETLEKISIFTLLGDGFRSAAVFCGAAAFGGAAAFAVLLALGWRPVTVERQLAQASANNSVVAAEIANDDATTGRAVAAVAANDADNSMPMAGGIYNAEAISGDPLGGLVFGGSAPASNSDEDMLFCVPEEDGSICSSSAGQG